MSVSTGSMPPGTACRNSMYSSLEKRNSRKALASRLTSEASHTTRGMLEISAG